MTASMPSIALDFPAHPANLRQMKDLGQSPVKAVLGPTNTGKTHLAVERMCAHSSGLIGFPLRLLAREVYDRVVKLKGSDKEVALITGEEKIVPPQARWFLTTAESMPVRGKERGEFERDFAFVAVDEAQLGAIRSGAMFSPTACSTPAGARRR
jgi:ATP-dependent RNA helicase SUPV3L1/SUV3